MPSIKLIKEPGYLIDLSYGFYFYFNKDYCLEHHINEDKADEYKAHYQQTAQLFDPISDDLYVFFHALQNGRCFFSANYILKYKEHFTSGYNLTWVQKELSDYAKVVERVIRFYFPSVEKEDAKVLVESREQLFEIVKVSDYSDTDKSRLYEFFMSPVPYIQKLQYELMKKDVRLSDYYEKNYSRILDAYNGLTYEIISKQIEPLSITNVLKNEHETLYLSFCLINKNHVNFATFTEGVLCFFGDDYVDAINSAQNKKEKVKLDEIGAALSEASRVQMLDLMLERGEINCKELEKTFNFSGSTAYHHLTILLRYGVIKTRNIGKTIYYSVNQKCFETVIEHLRKYTEGK